MEIYLDVLFLENLVINFLILYVTSIFSKVRVSSLRIAVGAAIGASYVAVLILLPGMKVYGTIIAKLLLSAGIIAITFTPEKLKSFLKVLAMFYVSSFIFAGAAFAFIYFNQSGGFVRNGIVYVFWRYKLTVLVLSLMMVGIVVKILIEIIQSRTKEKYLMPIKISFEDNVIELAALVDTGNSLHDPLTNMPVIIVEYLAIKDVLPADIQDIFKESKENDLDNISRVISNSKWFSRFRLIPFMSIGKDNGILIGFKPDYIEIGKDDEKKGVKDVVVGICNKTLSRNEGYRALLNPELV